MWPPRQLKVYKIVETDGDVHALSWWASNAVIYPVTATLASLYLLVCASNVGAVRTPELRCCADRLI